MEMYARAEREFFGEQTFDREQQFYQFQNTICSIKNHCVLNKKNHISNEKHHIFNEKHHVSRNRAFNGKQCKNPASLIADRVFFCLQSQF